jgi:hypothetical protein
LTSREPLSAGKQTFGVPSATTRQMHGFKLWVKPTALQILVRHRKQSFSTASLKFCTYNVILSWTFLRIEEINLNFFRQRARRPTNANRRSWDRLEQALCTVKIQDRDAVGKAFLGRTGRDRNSIRSHEAVHHNYRVDVIN